MFNVMDELSELIYVADLDTYELLFLNTAGKKTFGVGDIDGRRCYEVLHKRDRPCDFCTNKVLRYDCFYNWDYSNPITRRHYLLKDKLVDWEGKRARIEIAFDVTEKERQRSALRDALNAENLLMECVELLQNQEVGAALEEVLKRTGEYLEADRALTFKISGGKMTNLHEWCAPWAGSQKAQREDLPVEWLERWKDAFLHGQCVIIEPEKSGLAGRSVLSPFLVEGRLAGFIAVENPAYEKMENIGPLIKTLGNFIASSIQRQQDKQKLERLSYYDTLTGALNRNAFMQDSESLVASKNATLGIVYVDINGMKELNDLYGHPYGDRILSQTAGHIKTLFPEDLLYRVGGDEFVVICKDISDIDLESKVQALKALLTKQEDCKAAVGSQWSNCSADIQRLIFEADERMYQDKKQFYRSQAVPRRYRHRHDDVLGLTKPGVLQELLKKHRFPVYFQPKINVSDGSVIGAEALVRHCSSSGELVPPGRFIPLLEETRLISNLDFYVFQYVCQKIALWLEAGKAVSPVSVNFSRYSLCEPRFVERLVRIWEHSGIPKEMVEIEITESGEAGETADFLGTIKCLQSFGFSISIDDFGVKYASFPLFTAASFDVLKIDRSLISELPDNKKTKAVVQSISNICKQMNVRLIVEGVETQEQLGVLRELGCDGAQGYLFSRPLPLEEYEAQYI